MEAWDAIKAKSRRVVHDTFGVAATYAPPGSTAGPLPIKVRHHTREVRLGDLDREGYAETAEDINRLVFWRADIDPVQYGIVIITSSGLRYRLEIRVKQDDKKLAVWDVVSL